MQEYIIYAILIFFPIGLLIDFLLRREGLMLKYRLVIISAALVIIITFPILMGNLGLPIAIVLYIAAILGLTGYFIKATQSQSWYLRQAADASEEVYASDRIIDMTKIQTIGDFEDAFEGAGQSNNIKSLIIDRADLISQEDSQSAATNDFADTANFEDQITESEQYKQEKTPAQAGVNTIYETETIEESLININQAEISIIPEREEKRTAEALAASSNNDSQKPEEEADQPVEETNEKINEEINEEIRQETTAESITDELNDYKTEIELPESDEQNSDDIYETDSFIAEPEIAEKAEELLPDEITDIEELIDNWEKPDDSILQPGQTDHIEDAVNIEEKAALFATKNELPPILEELQPQELVSHEFLEELDEEIIIMDGTLKEEATSNILSDQSDNIVSAQNEETAAVLETTDMTIEIDEPNSEINLATDSSGELTAIEPIGETEEAEIVLSDSEDGAVFDNNSSEELLPIEPDNSIEINTNNEEDVNQLIDQGFMLMKEERLTEALKHFGEALSVSTNDNLSYLLLMEMVNIYKDMGLYAEAEELLFVNIGKAHMGTDIINEIDRQLSYIRLLSIELNRLGLANTPISEVPRWIRINVAEMVES